MKSFLRVVIAACVCALPGWLTAQVAAPQTSGRLLPPVQNTPSARPESLLIGPGDVLHVQVVDAPEMEQHVRVTDNGMIPLVGAGDVKVGGLTIAGAQPRFMIT